jgi:hypothetical protein
MVVFFSSDKGHVLDENLPSGPWSMSMLVSHVSPARIHVQAKKDLKIYVQLEVEDHAQLIAVRPNGLDQFRFIINARHLAHAEGIILLQDSPQLLEVLVTPWAAGVVLATAKDCFVRVRECLILADKVDDVQAEAISAPVKPEAHDLVDSFSNGGVLPVQIRLLLGEQVQVIFVCSLIVLPSASYYASR